MKSILFDFGGTLDGDGVAWLDRFYPLYKEAGVSVSQENFNRAFYDSDDLLAARFPLKGQSLERTLSWQVRCVLEALAPDKAWVGEQVVERFLEDCRRHFRRNRPILERLRRRYRLGVVSNFYGNLESVLASEGLSGLFEAVADSGSLGVSKPSAEIFLHALSRLEASPQEALMVGDSIPRDMKGAEALAMPHALLGHPEARCCPGAWALKSLPDLEALCS